jgi:hypothetical protein
VFTSEFILGPYFFEETNSHLTQTVTVTSARYAKMINDHLIPELTSRKCLDQIIFQQDGAPPHTSILVHQLLREYFNNRVISNGLEIKWPPRSPDFSQSDYWLWGYLG